MCGIIGVASREPVRAREWLKAGRDAMRHRGPDDTGEWWSPDTRVGLGHRRLAVIDLSPGGHQPMADPTGELQIVFNGEIYNFRELRQQLAAQGHAFRSESDTEVILAAYREWGPECVGRLNGMFAFALYDARSQELLLARDRAGEKPLFYREHNGELRFASELKGLMADETVPRRIDAEALDCFLTMGFVPGERCILQGYRKLRPGHALVFRLSDGQLRTWSYWRLPQAPAESVAASETELLEELEALLADSVRRQLIADVPIGVLLSGGVDSSLVTAMAVRASPRVKTFTMRFPGHGKYDETEHARLIAAHFGTEHVELDAEQATTDLVPMLATQFDEPVGDSSMIPTYLVSRLTRRHCTVALGGDGGDELFGGYAHYSRLLRMQEKIGGVPRAVRALLSTSAQAFLPVGFRGRNWLQGVAVDLRSDLPWVATHFDRGGRRQLMRRERRWALRGEQIRRAHLPETADLLQRATRSDFENYMVEDILAKVDRASMLNSLEVRAPFLDHRLVEFAFGKVPRALKATGSEHKILLKKLVARQLPPSFDRHRKHGFSIPLASWLQAGPWRQYFREVLLGSDSGLFCKPALQSLLDGQDGGRANSERLFALVVFELWRQHYRVAI
ncbi:MAG: asparagine synthase (glutamine-hydrolyzing) [Proteobacteria bacterium]|nr:asparagine synthase (glutamine-hydrolyzing) [Pseudomonadota bacterium]